ncbi:ribosome silencing factor [Candidatus Xianfuyuplasma coldseepsis]|uniref:Ribosomal silencing factor RsfS n=1 Tax=Candidatus Xianfuyuplasma coldseepsis TaxID=2782163 RepID=A0A7L7KSP9_9MOLU|nr:ribosome silencing factor [Xianfuyuplasma coldseepsis]QMS85625.1 ribosome silencing factor [Xianfuyuplasma coldseepsis]
MKKIEVILQALEDVKLQDVEVYDMKEKSPFFDYLIISSATNNRQLQASIQHVTDNLAKHSFSHPRIEGKNSNSWILIDAKDIIVNVFTKEEREFYNLEKMLVEIRKLSPQEL